MKYGALLVTAADGTEVRYGLDVPSLMVGSEEGCEVRLLDPWVAERHCRLSVESGSLLLQDLGSERGTSIDGRRVTPHEWNRVSPGQRVEFGTAVARYIEPGLIEVDDYSPSTSGYTADVEAGRHRRPLSKVVVEVDVPRTAVATGSRLEGVVRVENRGRVVDEVSLALGGVPEAWADGWTEQVRLVPGATVEVPLALVLPVTPEALAGEHEVVVTATSAVDGRTAVGRGVIEILPFEAVEVEVDPPRSTKRFALVVRNDGNAQAEVDLDVVEDDDRLRIDLEERRVTLEPGEERRVGMRGRIPKKPLFGRTEVMVFLVAATPRGGAGERVERFGQFSMTPRLQPWRLTLQVTAAMLLVAAVCGVFIFDWPRKIDVEDLNPPDVPAVIPAISQPTVEPAKTAPTTLAGVKKDDPTTLALKLEERYTGVHLCGSGRDTTATKTPAPSSPKGPLFRQTDPAWASDVYAFADKAKSNCGKTVGQCGCAITSMATVLTLMQLITLPDGMAVNPGSLNRWFQQDAGQDVTGWSSRGYAYGDVVWSAVNTLSAQSARSTPGSPRIRYLAAGSGNDEEIRAALDARIPVVLEVPGHYIAATGYVGDKIAIYDPFYPDRTTLDAYAGKVLGSVLFQASNDLSALTITVGAEMRVRVTAPDGKVVGTLEGATGGEAETKAKREVAGSSYTFKDAWRDPNCIESAPPSGAGVHQIHITTPVAGAYKVEIINAKGGGTAGVIYMYDRDGNLRMQREEGTGNRTVMIDIG